MRNVDDIAEIFNEIEHGDSSLPKSEKRKLTRFWFLFAVQVIGLLLVIAEAIAIFK